MNPSHKPTISPHPTPTKPKDESRGPEIDVGEELSGYGLEGVSVSEQDLMDLVSELIGEEGAGDLVKGFKIPESKKKEKEVKEVKEEVVKDEVVKDEVVKGGAAKGEVVNEVVEKKGHDNVVQELAGKLDDVKLGEGKDESTAPSTKPEAGTKPTEGPPEVKQEDNLVTEATPSDADKATS
jgi:hypothetical protein